MPKGKGYGDKKMPMKGMPMKRMPKDMPKKAKKGGKK